MGSKLFFSDSAVLVVSLLTLCLPSISVVAQTSTANLDTTLIHPSFSQSTDSKSTAVFVTGLPSSLLPPELSTSLRTSSQYVDLNSSSFLSESYLVTSLTGDISSLPIISTGSSALSSLGSNYVEILSTSVTESQLFSENTEPFSVLQTSHLTLSFVEQTKTTMFSSSSSYSGGMNSLTTTESSLRTTLPSNDTAKSTPANTGDWTTSTLSPGFGNGSCSGNNTGCPEYNGRDTLSLSTPAIIGIAVGAAVFVILIVCLVLCVCRRRRTLSGSKADLSAYWDDNVTLSYINGHLDYPKDINDEMVSLDNDSFLNSLDSMSFSNMWVTETAKHTNL